MCSLSELCSDTFPFATVTYRMEAINRCAQLVSEGWIFSPGGSRVAPSSPGSSFGCREGGRERQH